jgi:integrase
LTRRPGTPANDAVVRWCAEQSHKATAEEDKAKLRWLDRHLGNKTLDSINRDMIERIARAKQKAGCSNATVNRTLVLVRAMLRKCAREWQWLDRAPMMRMLKEPTRRVRYLTHAEAGRLLAELPPHLPDMAAFSLESGLRSANVTRLKSSAVDLKRKLAWVHPDEAKARKAIPVPLNGAAMAIVQKQIGKHQDHVFTFKARRIEQLSTAVQGLEAGGHREFPMARSPAYVGQLACPERNAAACLARAGWLGELRHGAALRSFRRRPFGAVGGAARRRSRRPWHKFVTTRGCTGIVTRGQAR